VCGIDQEPTPGIDSKDVSGDNKLSPTIAASDYENTLKPVNKDANPGMEAFNSWHFRDMWNQVFGISNDGPPPGEDQIWRNVGDKLHTATEDFKELIKSLRDSGGWEGKTIEAAYSNAIDSVDEPYYTGTAAFRAANLTNKWHDVVQFLHDKLQNDPLGEFPFLVNRYDRDLNWKTVNYNDSGGMGPGMDRQEPTTAADKAEVNRDYDDYMHHVMNDSYKPCTESIWRNYPQFDSSQATEAPREIPGLPQKPGKPTDKTRDPSTVSGGGTPSFGGGGGPTPSIPKTSGSLPEGLQQGLPEGLTDRTKLPDNPTTPGQSAGSSLTDPSQAVGAASGLGSGLSQALGSATQAAKAPPGGTPKGSGPKPNMPEGALQLGKGAKGTGSTGGGSGGASLGGAPKGLPTGLPGQPAAATQATAAGASQPGTGAGAPGMGPPGTPGGAGHGAGGAQQGKEHKINKALRSRKTGAEIAGDSEAVVPVIGQDQDQDQGEDQPADRRQRDPAQARHDVRGTPPAGPTERGERGVRAH
jgi:hypothetical protein